MAISQRKIIRFWWNLMYNGTFGTRWQPDDQIWTFLNSRWRTTAILTSSSAVTKRPRDAWYLSVVSVIASIVQYLERSFFLLSLLVTSTSNLPVGTIRLCSVVFAVTSSLAVIHTIHGRPWICIARDRAWSVSRCTQTTVTVYSASRLVVQYLQ